jgi:hypothetical protein
MSEKYVPGVCNIGREGKKKRYALGFAGIGATFLLLALIVLFRLPEPTVLVVFLTLMLGFEGIYQGILGFCAGFAMQGIYDVSDSGDSRETVDDEDDRAEDLSMAKKIHLYSAGSALIVTAILYGLFVFI